MHNGYGGADDEGDQEELISGPGMADPRAWPRLIINHWPHPERRMAYPTRKIDSLGTDPRKDRPRSIRQALVTVGEVCETRPRVASFVMRGYLSTQTLDNRRCTGK